MADPIKFDSALEEPIGVEIRGEVYWMVGAMPALLVLKGIRASLDESTELDASNSMILEALETSFMPGELDRILMTGISFPNLTKVLGMARRRWAGAPDEGEALPPATAEPAPSSNDSTSSRATSSESTELTSGESSEPVSDGDGSSPSLPLSPTALSGG